MSEKTDSKDLLEGYVDHILQEEGYETWCEARCTIARAKKMCLVNDSVEFGRWLMEIYKTHGFHDLGEGNYRYNYRSSYTMDELYGIFLKIKNENN